MSERDREILAKHVEGTANTIRQYVDILEGESSPAGREAIYALAHDEGVDPDDFDYTESLQEWPLEIVDERGREFAVVLSTGGPHVEVVADGLSSPRLEGYWGGERVTRYGDYLSTFLDYFIER
ncbi:hypothetical protein A5747_13435 [Mycobacterium sp. IS-836]|uniref:hypothetical protein n=1 Tax=Mycobacterium sp. IS-836 TaxID=1834160 RepID=UPI00096C1638|nr:hypothetical protein [Mycobacterium sp. IS-836]OMC55390.1 hypothetical protein A5747_13435 [Mycobacterium sp. IS-836]